MLFYLSCQITHVKETISVAMPEDDTGTSVTETEDTLFSSIVITPEEMNLVYKLEWTADEPVISRAVFQTEYGRQYKTPWTTEPATIGTHQLIGIPADASFTVFLEAEYNGEIEVSEMRTLQSSMLPSAIVTPVRQEGDFENITGFTTIPQIGLDATYLLMLDGSGEVQPASYGPPPSSPLQTF